MNEFLLYLVKANVALALFYLGYRFFLKDLTFYRLNRYYFLLAFIFASLYPAVDWLALFQERVAIPATMMNLAVEWQTVIPARQTLSLADVLEYMFWTCAGVFAVRLAIQLSGLWRIHIKSSPTRWRTYAYRKSAEDIVPFSFWKNVYMNPDRHLENEYDQILEHEFVHVRQLHSLDILLTELTILFFWYNPFCWLLRSAVRENIEFITDRRVLQLGIDRKSYQYSLLNITTLSFQPVLGAHFNLKNLKKRIMMMNKKQSSNAQLSKYALILPLVVAGSLIFGLSHARQSESLPEEIKRMVYPTEATQEKTADEANQTENVEVFVSHDSPQDTLKKKSVKKVVVTGWKTDTTKQKPLIVLDGKILAGKLDQINPEEIESIEVIKDEHAEAYGDKGKHGVIIVTSKKGLQKTDSPFFKIEMKKNEPGIKSTLADKAVLILVDGVKVDKGTLSNMDPKLIKAITVFKDENTTKKYGDEAKDGLIQVTTHQGEYKPSP